MELALFDLDYTLLSGDSDHAWAQFLIEQGVLDRAEHEAKNERFFRDYQEGRLDIDAFLEFQLAPLARHEPAQLAAWHARYMHTKIRPMIRARGLERVRRHADHGDLCAIVTSTNSFVTAPIARELGVEHLLATDLEMRDGRFTGKVSGVPCYREGKVLRVSEWLGGRGQTLASFSESWFYSDSRNDLPLLECVTRPVAVDPDETLRREASARGWPIISLE